MKFMKIGISAIIIGAFFVIGLIIGRIVLSNISPDAESSNSIGQVPVYPVNENGQTYGSALYSKSFEEEPDLISAYGIDNTPGYVLKEDLNSAEGGDVKSPEEAIKWQKERSDITKIPLYDVDGKTVIGEFELSAGDVEWGKAEDQANGIVPEDKTNAPNK